MKIINYLQLQKFWQRYPDAEEALKAWFYEMRAQTWQEGKDVLNYFSNARLFGKEGISFEIIPDKYHVKAIFKPSRQILFIQQIAKHQKRTLQNSSSFLDYTEEIMPIRPIYTQEDLQETVDRLEDLFNAQEGTPEYDQFIILSELVLAFQRDNTKMDFPDPIEAIRYHIWWRDQDEEELGEVLGSHALAQDILNRKKKLTLPMIWKLCTEWQIPAECLIKPYE